MIPSLVAFKNSEASQRTLKKQKRMLFSSLIIQLQLFITNLLKFHKRHFNRDADSNDMQVT